MRIRSALRRPACHWEHIVRAGHDGQSVRTVVWICEYPYRTILTEPTEDCHNRHEPVKIGEAGLHPATP